MAARTRSVLPALHPELTDLLLAALAEEGLPTDAVALAQGVAELSAAYNAAAFPVRWTPAREAGRVAFFLPRDARKIEAALRDLPLAALGRPALRVLDLGAGVGGSGLGAVLGLRGRGYSGEIALTLVEPEPRALTRGLALLRRCVDGLGLGPVTVQGLRGDLRAGPGEFDLVVLGAVLVEVGHGQAEAARVELLRQLLRGILAQNVGGDGLLLVVEPALKVTSRRLQQVREALRAEAGLFVVAPCPHAEACPLLTRAEDWCHEDLAVDLPAALVPIARAAGLRWQGLTYSRLALSTSPVRRPGARVVLPPHPTKGKLAQGLCLPGSPSVVVVERLDRHASAENEAWSTLSRGDGLDLPGASWEGRPARIGPEQRVLPFRP